MSTPDLALYDLAAQLLVACRSELALTTAGEPKECLVALVDHPWDSCCDGLLYVRVSNIVPTDTFPSPAADRPCSPYRLAAQFEVVHARCSPSPRSTARGITPPSVKEMEAAAASFHEDTLAVMNAVVGVVRGWMADGRDVIVGNWSPIGPEGGCVGGTMNMLVEVPLSA